MRAVSVPGAEPSKPSAQRKNVRSRSRLSRNRRYDIENGRRTAENEMPQNRGSPSVADARMLSRTIRRGPGPRPQFLSGSRLFQVINPLLSLPVPRAQPQPSQPAAAIGSNSGTGRRARGRSGARAGRARHFCHLTRSQNLRARSRARKLPILLRQLKETFCGRL